MRSTGFATRLAGVLLAASPLLSRADLALPPGYRATILHETPPGTLAGGLALDTRYGCLVFGAGTNLYRLPPPFTGSVQRIASLPPNVNVAALASIDGTVYTGLGRSFAFPFPHEVGRVAGGTYAKLFDLDGVYDFDADPQGNLYLVANPGGAGTQILRYTNGTLSTLGAIGGYSGGVAAEHGFGLFYANPNTGRILSYPPAAMVTSGLVSGVASTLVNGVAGSYLSIGVNYDLLSVVDFGNRLLRYSIADGSLLETVATDRNSGYGIGKAVQNFHNHDIALIFSDFTTFNSRIVSLRQVRNSRDVSGVHRACFALHNTRRGEWRFVDLRSNTLSTLVWGGRLLEPALAQFDDDGFADPALRDPSSGVWTIRLSDPTPPSGVATSVNPGAGPDVVPAPGDFNGDGIAEAVVFVPSNGLFWGGYASPGPYADLIANGVPAARGGRPVPADYDGDRHAERTVYQPASGIWLTYNDRGEIVRQVAWGWSAAEPVPADYDGDGRADIAVFHARSGTWYILRSSDGQGDIRQFGYGRCVPVPADYDGDLIDDLGVYDERTGDLFVMGSSMGFWRAQIGGPGWKPVRR